MNIRKLWTTALGAVIAVGAAGTAGTLASKQVAAAEMEQFIPALVYRTGPYAAGGSGFFGGIEDYMALLNLRDGGINGVILTWEECETAYNSDRGVECYERLKNKGPTGASLVHPLSTGITYRLIERATADKIPIISMGYGRTDAINKRLTDDSSITNRIPTSYVSVLWTLPKKIRKIRAQDDQSEQTGYRRLIHDAVVLLRRVCLELGFVRGDRLAARIGGTSAGASGN